MKYGSLGGANVVGDILQGVLYTSPKIMLDLYLFFVHVEQTRIRLPHFFSYSYYLVRYHCNILHYLLIQKVIITEYTTDES